MDPKFRHTYLRLEVKSRTSASRFNGYMVITHKHFSPW